MQRYGDWRVPYETTAFLIRRGAADIVDAVVARTGVDGLTAAVEIGQRAKALARSGVPVNRLSADAWLQIFDLYTDGRIPREGIRSVASCMASEPGLTARDACGALGLELQPAAEWQAELDGVLSLDGYLVGNHDSAAKRLRFIAGKAVNKLKGKAPAKEVAAYVAAQLQEVSQ